MIFYKPLKAGQLAAHVPGMTVKMTKIAENYKKMQKLLKMKKVAKNDENC